MTTLKDLFLSLQGQTVLFVRPGGNWGDYLIYLGAEVLAKRCSIKFMTVDYEDFAANDYSSFNAVYLHGSGGFNPWTSGRALSELLRAIEQHEGPIIQGPQTTADNEAYLTKLSELLRSAADDKAVYVFAREQLSYANLQRVLGGSRIQLGLEQDTALHLKRDDLSPQLKGVKQRYRLDAFREDNEMTGQERSFKSPDRHVTLDPAIYAKSFDHWVRIHAASRSIRTNRTHSAILGSILGIPTTMFASSSHKNRSIWAYSLESRGVVWTTVGTTNDERSPDGQANAADNEACGQQAAGRQPVLKRIKSVVRPAYSFIDLPRLRAEYSGQARRIHYRLKGVPWH